MDATAQPESRPRSSAKGAARRQEILDRAIDVFAVKGADGTSLRAIADAIGISHAALLHYFNSREALLVEVFRAHEIRRHHEWPEDAIVGRMIEAAELNVEVPGLVALYTTLVAGSLEPAKVVSRAFFAERFARVRLALVERIRAGQAAGTIRADLQAEAMAALVVAASDGLQTQWLLDSTVSIADSLALLESILQPPERG
ncbi:MAG: TetR/AcrR family transcriptional regulator [Microbacteriaceae bacterium]